jgi:integrase
MAITTNNGKKVRSVDEYLRMLKLAGRSEITIRNYRAVLTSYAQYLNIPLAEVHENLTVENLLGYADSRSGKSQNGRKTTLTILHRYFTLNGVEFDVLEANVMKLKIDEEPDDKPIELETLQKMMDQGNPHSRALLAFLVSTGCRAGECSKLLLSDVKGDVVHVRSEIAKRHKGGDVYLTAEAQEYLDVWLKDRERYIEEANRLTERLLTASTGHEKVPRKGTGTKVSRPVKDDRLFACSYSTMQKMFSRLYDAVDGEKKKKKEKRDSKLSYDSCTLHSLRKYFRTYAVKGGMSIDLVEGILRHTGYLNNIYVRMTDEERRKEFHAGEVGLYITRADHRIQSGELDALRRENERQKIQLDELKNDIDILRETAGLEKDASIIATFPTGIPSDKVILLNEQIASLNRLIKQWSE